jgi:hypothetical protein
MSWRRLCVVTSLRWVLSSSSKSSTTVIPQFHFGTHECYVHSVHMNVTYIRYTWMLRTFGTHECYMHSVHMNVTYIRYTWMLHTCTYFGSLLVIELRREQKQHYNFKIASVWWKQLMFIRLVFICIIRF